MTPSRSSTSTRRRARARLLSIPRDTYVTLSGMPSGTGLSTDNKINTAFNSGPDALIETIENTFGIPINHFVITSFNGVIDLVKAVGGINLDFPYPVRDNDQGNNNSGPRHHPRRAARPSTATWRWPWPARATTSTRCGPGTGSTTAAATSGRIQRQNAIIEAVIDKAKSSYNPLDGQRLPRLGRPRHHQGRRHVDGRR